MQVQSWEVKCIKIYGEKGSLIVNVGISFQGAPGWWEGSCQRGSGGGGGMVLNHSSPTDTFIAGTVYQIIFSNVYRNVISSNLCGEITEYTITDILEIPTNLNSSGFRQRM